MQGQPETLVFFSKSLIEPLRKSISLAIPTSFRRIPAPSSLAKHKVAPPVATTSFMTLCIPSPRFSVLSCSRHSFCREVLLSARPQDKTFNCRHRTPQAESRSCKPSKRGNPRETTKAPLSPSIFSPRCSGQRRASTETIRISAQPHPFEISTVSKSTLSCPTAPTSISLRLTV